MKKHRDYKDTNNDDNNVNRMDDIDNIILIKDKEIQSITDRY